MTNREIAQEISNRIGTAPVPFDSVYSIALEIYHQLGGEEAQFDSVYSILLEILPLVEGGGKAIEIVDALPEASENKEKFFRLSSDDNVYVSELKSRTTITTNRLPDEQQIDKAYLYETSDDIYYYKGVAKLICTDGEIDGYVWQNTNYFVFTLDNAISASLDSICFSIDKENDTEWSVEGNIATTSDYDISYVQNAFDTLGGWSIQAVITAIYNAPESAQIGNAYVTDDGDTSYIYDGTEITLVVSDGQFIVYRWYNSEGSCFSTKQASNIYYTIQNDGDVQGYISDIKFVGEWDLESFTKSGNTYTNTSISYSEIDWYGLDIMGTTDLYIPQLNAPDSEQVGNATIVLSDSGYETTYYYKGAIEAHFTDGNLTVYRWEDDGYNIFSKYSANQQYQFEGTFYAQTEDGLSLYWDDEQEGYYCIDFTVSEAEDLISGNLVDVYDYINVLPVKYQRTEVTEEWGWEKVATKKYVDDAIDNIDIPEYSAGENIIIDEGVINTDGYVYNSALGAISLPGYYKQVVRITEYGDDGYDYSLDSYNSDFVYNKNYTGVKIYDEENLEIGTITSYYYEDDQFINVNITFKDGYTIQTGYVYHLNIPYHTLQNRNETALGGFTNSHTADTESGKTLFSLGLTQDNRTSTQLDKVNALEIMGDGKLYLKGVGGYVGNENSTTLATRKTLQKVIGEKADASVLADKANKVDATVYVDMMTEVVDWTPLNSFTNAGMYRVAIAVDYGGTDIIMNTADFYVTGMGTQVVQLINVINESVITMYKRETLNGTTWTVTETNAAVINDASGTVNNPTKITYSRSKIDSLISALDQRLTALGG